MQGRGLGGVTQTYTYDGNLKRVKSVENGVVTYWVYSKVTGNLIHKYVPSLNEGHNYLSSANVTVRDNTHNNGYRFTYLDAQGSVVASTPNGINPVSWREAYTPFGEKLIDPSGNQDNVGYTGHVQDDFSGLTYMQARFYDPIAGRFLSPDPIGYQDQLNLYAYVHNDPINHTDPTGERTDFFHMCNPASCESELVQITGDEESAQRLIEVRDYGDRLSGELIISMYGGGSLVRGAQLLKFGYSSAFKMASRGGRHSGFLKNHANASVRQLNKGIASLNKQIKAHEGKLKDPSKYVKDWASRSDKYKQGLMNKWKTDIARQKSQRDILNDLKKQGSQNSGQAVTGSRIRK